jgi:2-polyprenyl-3-methyl-5-hydroxy-6-metoxy-1,4-benzoquinol methylase
MTTEPDAIYDEVRTHYAAAARAASAGQAACCGSDTANFGPGLYDDLDGLRRHWLAHQLRQPAAVADLKPGGTVLDLGSGGGIDVLLSARRVGPTGFVYGLDMTPEVLALARRNAAEAGAQTSSSVTAPSNMSRCRTNRSASSSRTA